MIPSQRSQVENPKLKIPKSTCLRPSRHRARAVDREFNYKFVSDFGAGEAGGLRPPPHPPACRGAPPPGPPKRRSAPLAAAVVRFLATVPLVRGRAFSKKSDFYSTSHLSGAASLPGAELFFRNRTFFASHLSRAASLPGAELFSQTMTYVFEQATCPGQLRCLGQNCFSKYVFLEQATCPGQLRCPGQTFFSKYKFF